MECAMHRGRCMKLRVLIPCALLPLTASAQLLTFGVQGGVPAQTPLGRTNNKMPVVLGPTVDIHLVSGLSFSTGVLFSRTGNRSDNGVFLFPENSVTLTYGSTKSLSVEVPLLARYEFFTRRHSWRPFVTAGPSIRHTTIEENNLATVFSGSRLDVSGPQPGLRKTLRWNVDPAAGFGVDVRTGRFHLEPQVRYSYWGAGKNTILRKNQVNFLLGFRF